MGKTASFAQSHIVTLQEIADHLGVSKSTVSRALRGNAGASSRTTERIRAVAKSLGYSPGENDVARRLALRKNGERALNHVIAGVFPTYFFSVNFSADMFHGIMDVLVPQGFALLLTGLNDSAPDRFNYTIPSSFERGDVDGAISFVFGHDAELLAEIRQKRGFTGRPVVSLIYPQKGCSAVVADHEHGAYLAAKHLLDLGHRHIGHSFTQEIAMQAARLAAAQQAYRERGLDPERYLHYFKPPERWFWPPCAVELSGIEAVTMQDRLLPSPFLDFLRENPSVTAYLAHSDTMAARIWYIAQHAGLNVPEDLSLIGFDDCYSILDKDGRNLLTTVRVPLRQMGQEAARLIIAQVTSSRPDEQIVLPTEFIVRESTAPPKRR